MTGGAVAGGAVTGGAVTGAAVAGGAVTGAAVAGGAVTGAAVIGAAVALSGVTLKAAAFWFQCCTAFVHGSEILTLTVNAPVSDVTGTVNGMVKVCALPFQNHWKFHDFWYTTTVGELSSMVTRPCRFDVDAMVTLTVVVWPGVTVLGVAMPVVVQPPAL